MIKRLRIKFICINMTIVTIMLCLIFGLLYISTCRNLEDESLRMMTVIAANPDNLAPPSELERNVHLPYFCIMVNHVGETIDVGGGLFDLSDQALLDQILEETYGLHTTSGILSNYNLRFSRTETPIGQCFVFADITIEHAILRNLIRTFILTGCIAFLIFLGISILLARWAVHPIEKAWKQQKQFVADASHELKTPLTVIMTDAELLHAPDCTEEERTTLSDGILTTSGQMRILVESLLELARIDSGNLTVKMHQVSLSDIVQESAMIFEPVFYEKELPFSYHVAPEISIRGDETHLKQLVGILLDNATKYASPKGKTLLSLQQTSSSRCLLSVSNQGDPIPDKELKNLFKRFYRADKTRTTRHSFGLGLSVAESITNEHHGKIRAHSQGGYNSFYVELPL